MWSHQRPASSPGNLATAATHGGVEETTIKRLDRPLCHKRRGTNYLYHNNATSTLPRLAFSPARHRHKRGSLWQHGRGFRPDFIATEDSTWGDRYSRQPVSLYRNDRIVFYRCWPRESGLANPRSAR